MSRFLLSARFIAMGAMLVALTLATAACGDAATPTAPPTIAPTRASTTVPTVAPTAMPTAGDTMAPTAAPTATSAPTMPPTLAPTATSEADLPGKGVSVKMARATWDTGFFHAEIYRQGLEALGYEVGAPTTLDNPPFYQAVAQGDVDFWVNGWFPLHNTYFEEAQDNAEIAGTVSKGGALQGYLVDKKTADALGITSLEDFKKPEVKEAFDANGDGKADLVACPPGWGCELVIEHQLDAYELRDAINPIKADYAAAMAEAISRYQAGEPIFFYTWTPNWTVGKLVPGQDVVWIETPFPSLPEDQAALESETTVAGVVGCVNDPCALGWPPNDIDVVANKEFLANNPAAAKLFQVIQVPLLDIFEQNARMFDGEDSAADIRRHAAEWIAAHQSEFDGWIAQAIAAGGP